MGSSLGIIQRLLRDVHIAFRAPLGSPHHKDYNLLGSTFARSEIPYTHPKPAPQLLLPKFSTLLPNKHES